MHSITVADKVQVCEVQVCGACRVELVWTFKSVVQLCSGQAIDSVTSQTTQYQGHKVQRCPV